MFVHGRVSKDKLFKRLAPMLKVFAFERAGAGIASGFLIVNVTAHFPFGFAKGMDAVAAGAPTAVVLIVRIRQVDEHVRFRKHFGGVQADNTLARIEREVGGEVRECEVRGLVGTEVPCFEFVLHG